MLIRNTLSITVLLITVVPFGQMCIAGTWRDNFSDRANEDWGPLDIIDEMSDEYSVGIRNGRFNFRGKRESANLRLVNRSFGEIQGFLLAVKFMIKQLPPSAPPKRGGWWEIGYVAFNEETGEDEATLEFSIQHALGKFEAQDVATVSIAKQEPEEHPQIGRILRTKIAALAHFAYEEEVWYTLRIEADDSQYMIWIGDVGLQVEYDSVPSGLIELRFVGMCNIWLDDFTVTGPTVPDGGPGSLRAVPVADRLTTSWGELKARN